MLRWKLTDLMCRLRFMLEKGQRARRKYQALRWGQLITGHQPEMCFSYCVLMKAVLERVICVWQSTIFLTSESVPCIETLPHIASFVLIH